MYLGGGVSNAYFTSFDLLFQEMLVAQGGRLMAGVNTSSAIGDSTWYPQYSVGDATYRETGGETTKYANQSFESRQLRPRVIDHNLLIEQMEIDKMGIDPSSEFISSAANACGRKIDEIIMTGILGDSMSKSIGKPIPLPITPKTAGNAAQAYGLYKNLQIIPWASYLLNEKTDGKILKAGLNTSKLSMASTKLTEAFNYGQKVCVGSPHAIMTLMNDQKMSNIQWSPQQSLYKGFLSPWGEISAFLIHTEVPKNLKSCLKANGSVVIDGKGDVEVEHAFIYDTSQIKFGIQRELTLTVAQDPTRNMATVTHYEGSFGAVRMFEKSVVVIEVATTPPADTQNLDPIWNYN